MTVAHTYFYTVVYTQRGYRTLKKSAGIVETTSLHRRNLSPNRVLVLTNKWEKFLMRSFMALKQNVPKLNTKERKIMQNLFVSFCLSFFQYLFRSFFLSSFLSFFPSFFLSFSFAFFNSFLTIALFFLCPLIDFLIYLLPNFSLSFRYLISLLFSLLFLSFFFK